MILAAGAKLPGQAADGRQHPAQRQRVGEELGGQGLGMFAKTLVVEELSKSLAGFSHHGFTLPPDNDIRNFGQKSIDEVKIKLHQLGLSLKDSPASFDPSEVAGYDVATGTWTNDSGYDLDADQDYAETEQL